LRPSSGKYEWIDRTEAVLVLQRVWRAYAASTLAALTLHASQQRRLGGVRSVLHETALLPTEHQHACAHHGARTPSPQVRSVLHETALLPTEHRLSWLGVISATELEQQRRQLTTTLRELIQARADGLLCLPRLPLHAGAHHKLMPSAVASAVASAVPS
jgi:hypothetical protein